MARIRTIKPKFWDDSKIGKLSRDARLLYIGLWTFSDDIGVVIGDSIWLKSKIFPYDQIQIQQFDKWIMELVRNGFICLLSYKDERFIYLPNFTRHQVINRPNMEDLNIPKDLIDNNKNRIIEQSLINHGTIIDLSMPIEEEEKDKSESNAHAWEKFVSDSKSQLLSDEEWLAYACRTSGLSTGFYEMIPAELDNFFSWIVSTGEKDSLKSLSDVKRRFTYWWQGTGMRIYNQKQKSNARNRYGYPATTSSTTGYGQE